MARVEGILSIDDMSSFLAALICLDIKLSSYCRLMKRYVRRYDTVVGLLTCRPKGIYNVDFLVESVLHYEVINQYYTSSTTFIYRAVLQQ
jgi:hypothetical protein